MWPSDTKWHHRCIARTMIQQSIAPELMVYMTRGPGVRCLDHSGLRNAYDIWWSLKMH
jgi:hypothetical protein